MSDCVFWSFEDHMKHLGIPVQPFAHDLFKALRKPTLPEHKEIHHWGWADRYGVVHKQEDDYYTGYAGRPLKYYDFSYTHGAVAPLIINVLATYHGLKVRGQYDAFYPPEMLRKTSTTDTQTNIASVNLGVFGHQVEAITLEPAIYLMIDGQVAKHAMFETYIPHEQGMIAGAYQLYVP